MDKKVLISCPISSREWVLPYYLDSIYNLDYPKELIDIYWIINNSKDQSNELLQQFQSLHQNEYNSITIEEQNNYTIPKDERLQYDRVRLEIDARRGKINSKVESSIVPRHEIYKWLTFLRNKILKKTVSLNCDFLYSSDSDIILKSDSLKRLLSHNESIVANLLYNGFLISGIEQAHLYPNILKDVTPLNSKERRYTHISNYKIKNPDKNPIGTLLECDFSGASILMSQEVCKVTKYEQNLTYGEDEPWSWSARQSGHKIYCDISSYQYHAMSSEILQYFIDKGFIK